MMRKSWKTAAIIFTVVLILILIFAPQILNMTFEKTTRLLEQRFLNEAPPEYRERIREAFENFIAAFKANRLKKADLEEVSKRIKAANEDNTLTTSEIDKILVFIETITQGSE